MGRRHHHRPGDWDSVALRLEEIVAARCGGDPYEVLFTLLVARLEGELSGAGGLDARLARARERWPGVVDGELELDAEGRAACAEVLGDLRLMDAGMMGLDVLFEFVVGRASKGSKGQFFTPRHVVREVVRWLEVQPGEVVCDPACGSGAFLVHSWMEQPACRVVGADLDPRAVRMARVMLGGVGADASLGVRDSLTDTAEGGVDVVATNPPFAGDVGDRYPGYALDDGGRVERDVLFLERCVRLLRPGGRLAIVLPHNKFGAARWAGARRWLLRHMDPVAVVGLGRETFLPHTSQKACVFVGRRRAEPVASPTGAVRFVRSERSGKDARGRLVLRPGAESRWEGVDHDLAGILGRGVVRPVEELAEGDVLAPERYDPRRVLDGGTVTLGEVAAFSTERFRGEGPVLVLDTKHAFEGAVRLRHGAIDASEVGSAKRRLRPGDVIVSRLRPYLRQVAYVDAGLFVDGVEVACSTEFYVLRGEDLAFLVPFLLSEPVQAALAASQEGGHHPRVRKEVVAELRLPDGLWQRRDEVGREVQNQTRLLRQAQEALSGLAAGLAGR